MTRTYSQIDPAYLGPELALEEGGAVLVHAGTTNSLARVARGTVPRSTSSPGTTDSVITIESAIYNAPGTSDADTPAGRWALGAMTSAASLYAALGSGTTSFAWLPADGVVRYNGANYISGMPTYGKETYCSIVIDLVTAKFWLYVNGSPIRNQVDGDSLPAGLVGVDIYPALSICGPTAFGMKAHWQAGFTGIESLRTAAGWISDTVAPTVLRIAAGGSWTSQPTDTPANACWRSAVIEQETLVTRRVWFPPWGDESPQSSYGDLTIDNSPLSELGDAGRFDELVDSDVAGRVVELWRAERGSPFASRTVLATCIATSLEALPGDQARFSLRGALSQLEKPLQHRVLPPWTPEPWTPQPIAIGAVRQVSAIPLDEIGEQYLLNDEPLANIAAVYDDANVFNPTTDWTLNADGRSITLTSAPAGRITADLSASGDPIVPLPVTDPLGGIGEFQLGDLDLDGVPDGWEVYSSTIPANGTCGWASDEDGITVLFSNHASGAAAPIAIRTTSALLLANTTYRISVNMIRAHRWNTSTNAQEWLCGTTGTLATEQIAAKIPGIFSRVITIGGSNAHLYLWAHSYMQATCDWVRVEELVSYSAPDLAGCTLSEAVAKLMRRAGIANADWSSDDTDAIFGTLPAEFGIDFRRKQVTVLDALKAVLRSFCACAFEDVLGIIRFCQLVDPETVADVDLVLDLTITDLAAEPVPQLDRAPALTTQVYARPNWSTFTDEQIYAGADPSFIAALKAPGQLRAAIAAVLSGMYERARNADPFLSLFDDIEHARTKQERETGWYGVPRHFMVLDVIECDPTINPGRVLRLTYDRWGFSAGRKCFIHSVTPELDGVGARFGVWY